MLSNIIGGNVKVWIEMASLAIEILAISIIVVTMFYATARFVWQDVLRLDMGERYQQLKVRLGKSLLLGLEILVVADVVRTVALDATLNSVAVLGLLVLIRTFLSWSLVVEIEGRWAWAPERDRQPSS